MTDIQEEAFPIDPNDSSRPAKVLWFSFLGVWILTMLHYGAVAPWALATTALAVVTLNILAMIFLPGSLALSRTTVAWLAGLASIFLVQFMPLGPLLFPTTNAMRKVHGVGTLWPGTADTFLTIYTLVQLCIYLLTAVLVIRLRKSGLSLTVMLKGFGGVLVLQALYAVVQSFAKIEDIPFYGPRPYADSASGTLVSRNTFGGLMAMATVIAGALAYSRFAWSKRRQKDSQSGKRLQSGILWSLATALFIFCIVLSKSRGGALAAVIAAFMVPFLFKGKFSSIAAVGLLVIGSFGVVLADPSALMERFEDLDPFVLQDNKRVQIWASTLKGALHQPILGFGLGTHPHAFHPFQGPELTQDILHAHNEFVTFFFEGGAILLILMTGGLSIWAIRCWKAIQRFSGADRFLPTAVLCAAAAEVVHSIVDFDCRVTSAGMLFAALIGLAAVALRPQVVERRREWITISAVGGIAGLLLIAGFFRPETLVEKALRSPAQDADRYVRQALGWSPFQYQAAWTLAKSKEANHEAIEAVGRYGVAADIWPAHPWLQKDIGLWFWNRWKDTQDKALYDRAARSFQRLFYQRPLEVFDVLSIIWDASRPLSEYEGLLPKDKAPAAGILACFLTSKGSWSVAQELFDRTVPAVQANVLLFDKFGDALRDAGQWGMEAIVRERRIQIYSEPTPVANAARAWVRLEAWGRASERATQACRMDPTNMEWVILRADIFTAMGEHDKALEAYVLAVQLSPLDVNLVFKRAALYATMNLHNEAISDYRQILRAKPGDRTATMGLARELAAVKDLTSARRVLDEYIGKNPGDSQAAALRATLQ